MNPYDQSLNRVRLSHKLWVCDLEWSNELNPTTLVDPVTLLMDPTAHTVLHLILMTQILNTDTTLIRRQKTRIPMREFV